MPVDTWLDVVVIGAGPAGLAAAVAAHDRGAKVCLIEREGRPGGVLKQCIHDGFGIMRFGARLTGPEYAFRYVTMVQERGIPVMTGTYLLDISQVDGGFHLRLQNSGQGIFSLRSAALVSATGCRERSARQVLIQGDRPAGVLTAGTAQYMVNVQGYLPAKNCVILGSGDIGLIMARRLTLEGARVEGVYEIKPEPSGLTRNVVQCLEDYQIPLHLSSTVTAVHGRRRVEGVTVCRVDSSGRPLPGTQRRVPCDSLILSVGLIPENEILDPLGAEMDRRTGGPAVDQTMMTSVNGLFACGNAVHVNDLVDYVSESGEIAGQSAAEYSRGRAGTRRLIPLNARGEFLYTVPQRLDIDSGGQAAIYFRSSATMSPAKLRISADGVTLLERNYTGVRPPEMERLALDIASIPDSCNAVSMELRR